MTHRRKSRIPRQFSRAAVLTISFVVASITYVYHEQVHDLLTFLTDDTVTSFGSILKLSLYGALATTISTPIVLVAYYLHEKRRRLLQEKEVASA